MNKIRITDNFYFEEFVESATATRLNIDNHPDREQCQNLLTLCEEVLQPARRKWGKPMVITSGFRSKALNKAVGGVWNSYHLTGQACDIATHTADESQKLAELLAQQNKCDVAIIEHTQNGGWWVHVQWSAKPRHKIMKIIK